MGPTGRQPTDGPACPQLRILSGLNVGMQGRYESPASRWHGGPKQVRALLLLAGGALLFDETLAHQTRGLPAPAGQAGARPSLTALASPR
jgi:hypothetical protein